MHDAHDRNTVTFQYHWQVEGADSEFPSKRDLPDAVRYCVAAGMTRVQESVPDKLRRLKNHPLNVKPRDLDIWWLDLNFYDAAEDLIKSREAISCAQREAALAVIEQQHKRRVSKTVRQVAVCSVRCASANLAVYVENSKHTCRCSTCWIL